MSLWYVDKDGKIVLYWTKKKKKKKRHLLSSAN